MRVSGGPTATRCCCCFVNRSNRAKMSAMVTVLLAVLLLSAICISTVHCNPPTSQGTNCDVAYDYTDLCYRPNAAMCEKHCTPTCLKKYNLKGSCHKDHTAHDTVCWRCRCEGRTCGAVAFGANLLHTVYASCAAALVIYMGRN